MDDDVRRIAAPALVSDSASAAPDEFLGVPPWGAIMEPDPGLNSPTALSTTERRR
jgi:hypothetical protein